MERLADSLREVQGALEESGMASVAIGALAVAVWGEPRVTRDVDLKVGIGREDAARLMEALGSGYDPVGVEPLETLRRYGMLFTRDSLGTRVDFLLADTAFDLEAIRRGVPVELQPGIKVRVCTAEDLLVYKLVSTRPRDQEDALGVILRQGRALDLDYVRSWLRQFEAALDDSTLVASLDEMVKKVR